MSIGRIFRVVLKSGERLRRTGTIRGEIAMSPLSQGSLLSTAQLKPSKGLISTTSWYLSFSRISRQCSWLRDASWAWLTGLVALDKTFLLVTSPSTSKLRGVKNSISQSQSTFFHKPRAKLKSNYPFSIPTLSLSPSPSLSRSEKMLMIHFTQMMRWRWQSSESSIMRHALKPFANATEIKRLLSIWSSPSSDGLAS